jgi:hypothetical protein
MLLGGLVQLGLLNNSSCKFSSQTEEQTTSDLPASVIFSRTIISEISTLLNGHSK